MGSSPFIRTTEKPVESTFYRLFPFTMFTLLFPITQPTRHEEKDAGAQKEGMPNGETQ